MQPELYLKVGCLLRLGKLYNRPLNKQANPLNPWEGQMATKKPGVIGILTGGGDVPGLNPAIRAVTIRALREGYKVIGIRRGWAGLVDVIRDKNTDNSNNFQVLTEEIVNRVGR